MTAMTSTPAFSSPYSPQGRSPKGGAPDRRVACVECGAEPAVPDEELQRLADDGCPLGSG